MSVSPIDQYQNATPRAISQHKLKKVQLQKRFTLLTQDSIGHLKTLCMSVLSLAVAFESNENATAHRRAIKNASVRVWIQLQRYNSLSTALWYVEYAMTFACITANVSSNKGVKCKALWSMLENSYMIWLILLTRFLSMVTPNMAFYCLFAFLKALDPMRFLLHPPWNVCV